MTLSRSKPSVWLTLLLLALTVCAGTVFADPPSRVARLSVLRGDVSFSPAGEDNWHAANLNRPLVSGDKLYTDRDARAELDLGAVTVRLDERSSFSILDLDDRTVQLELTQGTLNLHVHKLYGDQRYEVDTPTLAFVINQPGEYRIDIGPQGDTTRVTVFDGVGEVFGEGDARYRVDQRLSYRFDDSRLRDVAVMDLPSPDDFDNWCFARDERYDNALSRRYVSDEVIGAADLDEYGAWDDMPSYGSIWFPARVDTGWAPYRSGHWAWIDPWGWTWVDNAPWGFAPFHYGRWVYVGNRWGWLPGPVALRPVYAPALVVFIGGNNWQTGYARGGAPVGWCPLGPRDVYVPPYRVSHGYFTHVNDSNSSRIDRNRLSRSYENYAHGRPAHDRDRDYAYRHNPAAVTAVSRETFVHARPVAAGRLHLKAEHLAHAEIGHRSAPAPTTTSLTPATGNARASLPHGTSHRGVITHNEPPPSAKPFATRLRAIERNGGRPLPDKELQQLNARHAGESRDTARQRVRVVGPEQVPVPSQSPDSQAPRSQEKESRAGRQSHQERALPSPHVAPLREPGRMIDQAAVERAPRFRDASPVERRNVIDRPASQPANLRTEQRRPPPARDIARERRREAPALLDRPQVRPAAPASRTDRQPSENPAPPAQQPPPRNQRPAPQEPAREAGRVRVARDKHARHDAEDAVSEPGAPNR